MADLAFLILLVLHMATVVAWMGGALVFVAVVFPSLRAMPPPARGGFMVSTLPRYVDFASGSSLAATATGIALYWYSTQGVPSLAPGDTGLLAVQAGAAAGLMALITMFGVSRPSSRKMVTLSARMAATPSEGVGRQLSSLQRRSVMSGLLGLTLLGLSLVLMVVGAEL